jgi:hypothetical protein
MNRRLIRAKCSQWLSWSFSFGMLAAIALSGCRTMQPAAAAGHDYLDNPGRSAWVRLPAGVGALIGHLAAAPFAILLFPTYLFSDVCVEGCDILVEDPPVVAPDATLAPAGAAHSADAGNSGEKPRRRNDLQIPLAAAPNEYSSGVGAAVLGWPFSCIESLFRDPPGPPPGQVLETPELPCGEQEPQDSFDVRPPPAPRPEASTDSGPPPAGPHGG